MRLTLRTLLAYRDGVLSPAETSDLHQRIRQTEVANNLLRRVENLVNNKQMLAPKVNGQGLGGDANTVAEYIDDTLASEKVPEFERICIAESDLALAELAHCHQLLAEALNSQVIVPPNLKSLADSLKNPQNQAALLRRLNIGKKSSASARAVGSIQRVDDLHPEKLVEALETKAVEVIATQRSQVQAPMVTSGGGSIKPQGLDLERPQLAHEVPEYLIGQRTGGWRILLAIGAMIALMSVIAWQALGPLSKVRDLFVANNAAVNDSNLKDSLKNSVEPPPEVVVQSASKSEGANAEPALDSAPAPSESDIALKDAENLDTKLPNGEEAKILDTLNTESTAPQPELASNTLRWAPNSDDAKSVLFLRAAVDGSTLRRITANTLLPDGSEIIVPPSMRPTLNLAGFCTWSVCGPTRMQLSQDEKVTITTSLCRAIAKGGAAGHKVTIAAPTGSVNLQFDELSSTAAVEVAYRPVSHGSITDKLAFKPFLIIVAVEGQLTVTLVREAVESKSIRLVVGEGVAFTDAHPIEFELGAIPTWYRAGNDRPLDVLAAADMHTSLNDSENVAAQLTSLCSDSRPETAALAIQSKMLLGDWERFAGDFLSNELMRSHWSAAIGLAEQLLAEKEQNSEALRGALEKSNPGRGDALYALLAGGPDSSQPKELLPKLVESLGSAELDERVLASHQLRRLTGKELGFQPSVPNRAVLQQWRRTITSGNPLISIESPLWEAKK